MTDQPNTGGNVPSQHACPNCGYCPHCGRSNQPKFVPYQPYPWYPWGTAPYWQRPYVTYSQGNTAVAGPSGQTYNRTVQ